MMRCISRMPQTVRYVYRLLREEGLFVRSTSGINVAAAVQVARTLGPGHTVVTVLCDGGGEVSLAAVQPGLARAEESARSLRSCSNLATRELIAALNPATCGARRIGRAAVWIGLRCPGASRLGVAYR
jgi:hypothetical protein